MRCFRANPSFGSSKRRTEIEKPSKRILLKNGGPAAGFTHALSQVNDWLDVFKEHWGTCLDAMKVQRKMVTRVRGVIIVGRASDYDAKALARLKSTNHGDVEFLTYDDLRAPVDALAGEFRNL